MAFLGLMIQNLKQLDYNLIFNPEAKDLVTLEYDPSIEEVESSYFTCLCSRLARTFNEIITPVFQKKLKGDDYCIHYRNLGNYCLVMRVLLDKFQELAQSQNFRELASLLIAANVEASFLIDDPGIESIFFLNYRINGENLDSDVLCSLSYNIGIYHYSKKEFSRAIGYFDCSLRGRWGPLISVKSLKAVQGKGQCLLQLQESQELISLIFSTISFLPASKWITENKDLLRSFIQLYVSAAYCLEPYMPAFLMFRGAEPSIISSLVDLELDCLSLLNNHEAATLRVLQESSTVINGSNIPVTIERLLLLSVNGGDGKEACQEAIQILSNSKKESLINDWLLFKTYCTLGTCYDSDFCSFSKAIEIAKNMLSKLALSETKNDVNLEEVLEYFLKVAKYLFNCGAFGMSLTLSEICVAICQDQKKASGSIIQLFHALMLKAEIYMELGQSGKSGSIFQEAKKIFSRLDLGGKNYFYTCYCKYLCSINNIKKAIDIRGRVTVEDAFETNLLDVILLKNDDEILKASEKCNSLYRNALKRIKKSKCLLRGDNVLRDAFLTISMMAKIMLFQGKAYMIDYYLKQGLDLAFKSANHYCEGLFALQLAVLNRLKNLGSSCAEFIKIAKKSIGMVCLFNETFDRFRSHSIQ